MATRRYLLIYKKSLKLTEGELFFIPLPTPDHSQVEI